MKNWDKYQFGGLAESLNAMRTYSPTYTPNPAYTAGMMFEYGAKDPAAVTGVIGDLLTQNLASFLSGWNFQQEPQRASMAKDGGMYYQKGGMVDQHLYGMDPRLANDPTKMGYDFDFRQTQNRAAQAQVQQPLNNMQSQNMFLPTLGERNRFAQAASILSRDNPNLSPTANTVNKAIGGASALTSGLFDMTKDVLSGIGTARQNQYAAKRAAEQMREATINQGFEQGRQDLFNQGYQQQGNLQFVQDGGTIPVSKYGMYQYPNQPVVVPSNNITMQGINKPVMAYPNGDQPQVMLPDKKYNFPNSTNVLEVPLMQNGGMIKLANGVYFDNNTQEFVLE